MSESQAINKYKSLNLNGARIYKAIDIELLKAAGSIDKDIDFSDSEYDIDLLIEFIDEDIDFKPGAESPISRKEYEQYIDATQKKLNLKVANVDFETFKTENTTQIEQFAPKIDSVQIAYDGSFHEIDLSKSLSYIIKVNNGVTNIDLGFLIPTLEQNPYENTATILIDNSLNSSSIATIVFNGIWNWPVGTKPIGGMASSSKSVLQVTKFFENSVLASWFDIET